MKKFICIIAAVCGMFFINPSFASARQAANSGKLEVEKVIDNYKGTSNFDVIKVGNWMIKLAGVKDASLKGIKSMIIVDYSDCDSNVKRNFTVDLLRANKECSKLMEVNESGETVSFFGKVSEDETTVENPMILTDSGELICIFGTISRSDISSLADLN